MIISVVGTGGGCRDAAPPAPPVPPPVAAPPPPPPAPAFVPPPPPTEPTCDAPGAGRTRVCGRAVSLLLDDGDGFFGYQAFDSVASVAAVRGPIPSSWTWESLKRGPAKTAPVAADGAFSVDVPAAPWLVVCIGDKREIAEGPWYRCRVVDGTAGAASLLVSMAPRPFSVRWASSSRKLLEPPEASP